MIRNSFAIKMMIIPVTAFEEEAASISWLEQGTSLTRLPSSSSFANQRLHANSNILFSFTSSMSTCLKNHPERRNLLSCQIRIFNKRPENQCNMETISFKILMSENGQLVWRSITSPVNQPTNNSMNLTIS